MSLVPCAPSQPRLTCGSVRCLQRSLFGANQVTYSLSAGDSGPYTATTADADISESPSLYAVVVGTASEGPRIIIVVPALVCVVPLMLMAPTVFPVSPFTPVIV